jgi:arsenate reductase-like glutaredoxin family protein/predicted  nucleic acid-binding Zn-ribbon protein
METTTVRREYTAAEIQEINKAAAQLHGFDESPEGSEHNADIFDEYFQKNRHIPITVENVVKCVQARKQDFKWLSQAQVEYNKVANQEPDRANLLANWLASQGKPEQLVNTGDQAYDNLRLLLQALRGYQIDSTTISHAIDRILHSPGPQKLHYVPKPRRTEPISEAAKNDNGVGFFAGDMVKNADGSWRSKSPAEQRREREAAERAKQPDEASAQSAAAREAQRQAQQLRGNSHSEDGQLQKIFVTTPGTSEINWPATYQARLSLQKSLNKAQEVRRFIR